MTPLLHPYRSALSLDEYRAVAQRLEAGDSLCGLARQYHIRPATLTCALRGLGLRWQSKPRDDGISHRKAYVLEQLGLGRTRHDLARELDTSPECVSALASQARRKLGLVFERAPLSLSEREAKTMQLTEQAVASALIAERFGTTTQAVYVMRYAARRKALQCATSSS